MVATRVCVFLKLLGDPAWHGATGSVQPGASRAQLVIVAVRPDISTAVIGALPCFSLSAEPWVPLHV